MLQTLITTPYRKTVLRDAEADYLFMRLGPEQRHNGVGVLVVDKSKNILMTYADRIPLSQQCLEIPRGGKEVDETAAAAAVREVHEETGLVLPPGSLVSLGDMHPDSSTLRSRTQLFLAQLDIDFASLQDCLVPQEGEVDQLMVIPWKKLLEMAESGEITDSFTLVAILRARNHLEHNCG